MFETLGRCNYRLLESMQIGMNQCINGGGKWDQDNVVGTAAEILILLMFVFHSLQVIFVFFIL